MLRTSAITPAANPRGIRINGADGGKAMSVVRGPRAFPAQGRRPARNGPDYTPSLHSPGANPGRGNSPKPTEPADLAISGSRGYDFSKNTGRGLSRSAFANYAAWAIWCGSSSMQAWQPCFIPFPRSSGFPSLLRFSTLQFPASASGTWCEPRSGRHLANSRWKPFRRRPPKAVPSFHCRRPVLSIIYRWGECIQPPQLPWRLP